MADICPKCGRDMSFVVDGKEFTQRIGINIPFVYDGVLYWFDPDCRQAWHRFLMSHTRLYKLAQQHIDEFNERSKREATPRVPGS